MYRPNITNLRKEISNNTIIIGDFITYLYQWIDHPDKNIGLNDSSYQKDLIDV